MNIIHFQSTLKSSLTNELMKNKINKNRHLINKNDPRQCCVVVMFIRGLRQFSTQVKIEAKLISNIINYFFRGNLIKY